MSHRYLAAPLILLAAALAACSGSSGSGEPATGGNDQAVVEPTPEEPDPGVWGPWQDALGGQPLDLSAQAVGSALISRLSGTDRQLTTDYIHVLAYAGSDPDYDRRFDIECSGATCTGENGVIYTRDIPIELIGTADPDYDTVMVRHDVSIAYAEGGEEEGEEWASLSGWLDHSVFFTEFTIFESVGGSSYGSGTAAPLATGAATWQGVMFGADTDEGGLMLGNAELTVDFANNNLDVLFSDIHTSGEEDGDPPVPLADIRFEDVPMVDGGFRAADTQTGDMIDGAWYGPNHAEAGGVFEHGSRGIVGSFGAARQ